MAGRDDLPHIRVRGTATTIPYTGNAAGGGKKRVFTRDRSSHGQRLLRQLATARAQLDGRDEQRRAVGISTGHALVLEMRSDIGFADALKSLEDKRRGIRLLNVREHNEMEVAVVEVPRRSLAWFDDKVNDYLTKTRPRTGRPENEPLVASVSDVRIAVLGSFWSDVTEMLPNDDEVIWWEVWLLSEGPQDRAAEVFAQEAALFGLTVGSQSLRFPDRVVVLAYGSLRQMARCAELIGSIAELRRAKETAEALVGSAPVEQREWIDDLLLRLRLPETNAPRVTILDTGVDRAHPLLEPVLAPRDMHSVTPAWGVADRAGHGTAVAGIAVYGDLTELMAGSAAVDVLHRLESVKLIPTASSSGRDPDLYGNATIEAVARAEAAAPDAVRTVCLAVTTGEGRDKGEPSSWSAALDELTSGQLDGVRRLLCVSSGNASESRWQEFPESTALESVHDPGQSWNALTVGAYTEKAKVRGAGMRGWLPLARPGDLSPSTTTSVIWPRRPTWPLKPDLVFEGGNWAVAPDRASVDKSDSLQLLSTARQDGTGRLLVPMGDTSAAVAQAARLGAQIQAAYPNFWPETVRALLVHSAEWTPAMLDRFKPEQGRSNVHKLLRSAGFGVPSARRAIHSARNALTLVVEEALTPFEKPKGENARTREMHLHRLPWPKRALEDLEDAEVELRVTLSYFVEPSPGRRGWKYRHRYASHGLRFDVNTPSETEEQFKFRVNKRAREEEEGEVETASDSKEWLLGSDLRHLGAVHSDRWRGTARQLAERSFVGVYPVIGWWRERPELGRIDGLARYALVVSIHTGAVEADVYTPVANMVGVTV